MPLGLKSTRVWRLAGYKVTEHPVNVREHIRAQCGHIVMEKKWAKKDARNGHGPRKWQSMTGDYTQGFARSDLSERNVRM